MDRTLDVETAAGLTRPAPPPHCPPSARPCNRVGFGSVGFGSGSGRVCVAAMQAQLQYDFYSDDNRNKWRGLLVPSLEKVILKENVCPGGLRIEENHGGLTEGEGLHLSITCLTCLSER
ncbi:son of sevenless homolog 1-like [Anoplopoma fimbria]|uniref:son of sevenless homolog 1-like n=1 Tax=Anoplopoma fimbria TaxID=229290 RepID=UPI0023EC5907|nr:son of sevenless homolog 1-like [Anoplopoma fimbria]